MNISMDSFPVTQRMSLDDRVELVLFTSHPTDVALHEEIHTKELFRFDQGTMTWQIQPECGSVDVIRMIFEPLKPTTSRFIHFSMEGDELFVTRLTGDTFVVELESGTAKFHHWERI